MISPLHTSEDVHFLILHNHVVISAANSVSQSFPRQKYPLTLQAEQLHPLQLPLQEQEEQEQGDIMDRIVSWC